MLQQMLAETKPGISGVPTQTPKTFVNYNDVDEEEYRRVGRVVRAGTMGRREGISLSLIPLFSLKTIHLHFSFTYE